MCKGISSNLFLRVMSFDVLCDYKYSSYVVYLFAVWNFFK
jgi:hypothetical protein